MSIYYVYAYIRSKDSSTARAGTPYYIGKGKGRRAWSPLHPNIAVPVNKSYIVIIEKNLSEIGALALERRLIRWWGRKIDNTGILINRLPGGDMPPDNRGRIQTALTRQKISKSKIGKSRPPDMFTHKVRQKMGESRSRGKNGRALSVIFNGIQYSCKRDACEALGIGLEKLNKLIASNDHTQPQKRRYPCADKHPGSKPVTINGVVYHSKKDAAEKLNTNYKAINKMIDV